MELKLNGVLMANPVALGFNRTLVELKSWDDITDTNLKDCFNRTLVELKFGGEIQG